MVGLEAECPICFGLVEVPDGASMVTCPRCGAELQPVYQTVPTVTVTISVLDLIYPIIPAVFAAWVVERSLGPKTVVEMVKEKGVTGYIKKKSPEMLPGVIRRPLALGVGAAAYASSLAAIWIRDLVKTRVR